MINKHTCHTHALVWNGALSEIINLIDWKVPFLHHYSAASSICGVAEGAESSQLLHQSQFVASTGTKKQLTGPERCCLKLWRECSRRKMGKRWGRGKRKNDTTESTRTHPDNRWRLRVSRRAPLRQRSVCNSRWLGHRQRTVDALHKINPKKCQLLSWKCKKDPNGLYETAASLIFKVGNYTAQYSEFFFPLSLFYRHWILKENNIFSSIKWRILAMYSSNNSLIFHPALSLLV